MGRVNTETFHLIYSADFEPIFFRLLILQSNTLCSKKEFLRIVAPKGEECGKVVLQLSLAEGHFLGISNCAILVSLSLARHGREIPRVSALGSYRD